MIALFRRNIAIISILALMLAGFLAMVLHIVDKITLPPGPEVLSEATNTITMRNGGILRYEIVLIGGREYIATSVQGGYALCPILPPP